jgi:hypothetical protein
MVEALVLVSVKPAPEATPAILRTVALLLTLAFGRITAGGDDGGRSVSCDLKGDGGLEILVYAFREGGLEFGEGRLFCNLTLTCSVSNQ